MKLIALILYFYFSPQLLNAQSIAQIDSINSIPRTTLFAQIEKNIHLLKQNLADAEQLGYALGAAKAKIELAVLLQLNGAYDESTALYLQGIRYFEEEKMEPELATAYGDLGYQLKRRDLEKAKKFMFKGIQLGKKYQLKEKMVALLNNYSVLMKMDAKMDSAIFYANEGLQLNYKLKAQLSIPFSLNNLAIYHWEIGQYKKAQQYLKESDRYRSKEKSGYGRLVNRLNWGDLYKAMGKNKEAIKAYQKVIANPDAFQQKRLVSYCYNQIADIYQKTKNFEQAYQNQKKYQTYKDSVLNYETNSRIAQLEIEFESERKDKELAHNKLTVQQQQIWLFGSALIILFLIIAVYAIYKFQLLKRNKEKQALELQSRMQQAEYKQDMMDEKLRISRELHDNIGSQLTFLIGSLDQLSYNPKKGKAHFEQLSAFGRETLEELRNTIWAMKKEDVRLSMLVLKLNEKRQKLQHLLQAGVFHVENRVEQDPQLTSLQMLNLLRIAQEAVQNALKYAQSSAIKIIFSAFDKGIIMKIVDDGVGFDPENITQGHGLENMASRCEQAGGQFRINSSTKGTEVICELAL